MGVYGNQKTGLIVRIGHIPLLVPIARKTIKIERGKKGEEIQKGNSVLYALRALRADSIFVGLSDRQTTTTGSDARHDGLCNVSYSLPHGVVGEKHDIVGLPQHVLERLDIEAELRPSEGSPRCTDGAPWRTSRPSPDRQSPRNQRSRASPLAHPPDSGSLLRTWPTR